MAQQPRTATPGQQAEKQQLSQKDLNFVKNAAMDGMAEVELGNLAEQNAQHDDVKRFALRMVRDHTAANNELMMIAAEKGVPVPQLLDATHKQPLDRMPTLRGADFDRAYMREMAEAHDKAVKTFRQQAQSAADPDIKAFAQQTLPVLEEHQKMAHDITRSLSAVGSSRAPR